MCPKSRRTAPYVYDMPLGGADVSGREPLVPFRLGVKDIQSSRFFHTRGQEEATGEAAGWGRVQDPRRRGQVALLELERRFDMDPFGMV